MPEQTEVQESPVNTSENVGFEEFSKARAEGKVVDDGEQVSTAGKKFDGKEWTNRDEHGRFAKVRENLAKQRDSSDYIRGIHEGLIPPDDSMDGDTWLEARTAQLRNGTNKITVPDSSPNKPDDATAKATDAAAETNALTPEQKAEQAHVEAHHSLISNLAAKMVTDPAMSEAKRGFETAIQTMRVPEQAIVTLGHFLSDIADSDTAYKTFLAIGKNPDAIAALARLHPEMARRTVLQLSREISQQEHEPKQQRQTKAPAPPDPVGARQVQSAFDVNDEKMSPDEWARKRTEQRRKAGHTF